MRYLFTVIRLFLQLSWFSFYATARLFLFMSLSGFSYLCHFPTLFSFSHCPHPLTSLPDFFFIYVIARLDRAIHHFMSRFSDTPVKPEYDNNKGHYFLVCVIARHSPLSVIARLDRAIQQFIFWHLRLFSLSSTAFLPVICGFSLCHYPA